MALRVVTELLLFLKVIVAHMKLDGDRAFGNKEQEEMVLQPEQEEIVHGHHGESSFTLINSKLMCKCLSLLFYIYIS